MRWKMRPIFGGFEGTACAASPTSSATSCMDDQGYANGNRATTLVVMPACILRCRHLEIIHVILSAAKDLARWTHRSFAALRACPRAKRRDDMQDTARGRSREIFSPNVYLFSLSLDIQVTLS